MSAPRFFTAGPLALGDVALPEAVAHHARRVLRLPVGAALVLFDGHGGEYHGTLAGPASARLTRFDPVERESPLAVTLLQALVANDKLDWIIEKATELGVAAIHVAPWTRSVVRLDGERRARREQHGQDVARAACAQCGRNRVPRVRLHATLAAACADLPAGPRWLLAPDADAPLGAAAALGCTLAVGPEGGTAPADVATLAAAAFTPARLGPRVLRTETAGVAALAVLQTQVGDLLY